MKFSIELAAKKVRRMSKAQKNLGPKLDIHSEWVEENTRTLNLCCKASGFLTGFTDRFWKGCIKKLKKFFIGVLPWFLVLIRTLNL